MESGYSIGFLVNLGGKRREKRKEKKRKDEKPTKRELNKWKLLGFGNAALAVLLTITIRTVGT